MDMWNVFIFRHIQWVKSTFEKSVFGPHCVRPTCSWSSGVDWPMFTPSFTWCLLQYVGRLNWKPSFFLSSRPWTAGGAF